MAEYCLPVEMIYNGRKRIVAMGPFEHSAEREFALTVNTRAINECSDLSQLKPVTLNLLQGWSALQTAFQKLVLENLQLRQALSIQAADLKAAEEIMNQASDTIEQMQCERQLLKAKRRPWPFG